VVGDRHPVRAAAGRWRRFWTAPTIALGALLSVVAAFVVVDVLGKHLMEIDRSNLPPSVIVSHFVAPIFLVLTMTVVVGSVGSAFRHRDPQLLLLAAIAAYFSVMVVFASMYYEMAFAADLSDAVFKYNRYRADALAGVTGPRYSDRRALAGIERRFWSGVDWPVEPGRYPGGLPPYVPSVTTAQMRANALRPLNAVVQFIPEASLAIFGDCLHLSVTTMTTVGYGDIVPRSLGARFATDSEAVCNTLLLIFGLGLIFGRRRGAET
jgi:energy-converting hydrogenase Eha subunit C